VDWCIVLVEAGLCSCDGCGGHLEDGVCLSYGCGHEIREPTRFYRRRGVAWFPVHVHRPGRCAHADAVRAQDELERQRQARTRSSAEELGDPRR
jgi:hypothetical protein